MSILDYDYGKHGWDRGGTMNPLCVRDCVSIIKTLVDGDRKRFEVTTDGGWPRVGWRSVDAVGERHGVPVVMLSGGPYGDEIVPWYLLSDIRRKSVVCGGSGE